MNNIMDRALTTALVGALVNIVLATIVPCLLSKTKHWWHVLKLSKQDIRKIKKSSVFCRKKFCHLGRTKQ